MQNRPTSVVVHGTPLQQSAVVVHPWPYCEHWVPASGGGPESGVPASGGSVVPHTPTAEPVGTTHGSGAQQSAVVVHAPPASTHALPQMKGGVPAGFGTHGKLQQSALEAQALPSY